MTLLDVAGAARPKPFSATALKRWAITGVATVASTYALDAIATAAGLLLVASRLLQGLDHALVLLFLAGTYVVWGAGLRVNLRANWALLEDTGTSTNVLSKAAYDLTASRTRNARARRIAAALGYVGSELAKETPYYAGALGAVLLTDSVSAKDAILFLGGANLGAAAYEYGLGRAVRAFLQRRHAAGYASFETDWTPKDYLADYYGAVEPDERRTIAFLVEAMREATPRRPVLVFGAGPTLHHVFPAATTASEIHVGDYLPANLREIERWLGRDEAAHDWRPFVRHALQCEGIPEPTEAEIAQREDLARAKVTRLLQVDLRRADPLGSPDLPAYATVISAYCADSATADRDAWALYMARIAGLVAPGGMLIAAALHRCRGYRVGGKVFPSANIDENDLRAVLEPCFGRENLTIEVHALPDTAAKGYAGILLVRGRGRRDIGQAASVKRPDCTPSAPGRRGRVESSCGSGRFGRR